jgi:hypothetical protein
MTAPKPTYIATVPAVAKVHRFARDAAEVAMFLDMLGLVAPDGSIVPDDARNYDMQGAGPVTTVDRGDMPTVRDLHPERCTTPAGLRNLGAAS